MDYINSEANKLNETEEKELVRKKTNNELAKEVIRGLWGNGKARKDKLTAAGYDYYAVQKIVNEMLLG